MKEKNHLCAGDVCTPAAEDDVRTMTKNGDAIRIEIVSDLICPWCFIGKRRFEKALAEIDFADRIKTSWQPFQLNPDIPEGGMDRKQYRTKKFGTWQRSQQLDAQVAEAGLEVGITFNYLIIEKTPNTFLGHRLIWYADHLGKGNAVAEELFKGYFCDGVDIGQVTNLVKIAIRAGLEEAPTRDFLISRAGTAEVKKEEVRAKNIGVNGVPAFLLNGEPIFSGAQDPKAIVRYLKEALCRQDVLPITD